jgi:hypothetical protein
LDKDPRAAVVAKQMPGGVMFRNCLIRYSAGELADFISTVKFEDCLFEIQTERIPPANGKMLFAKALDQLSG